MYVVSEFNLHRMMSQQTNKVAQVEGKKSVCISYDVERVTTAEALYLLFLGPRGSKVLSGQL